MPLWRFLASHRGGCTLLAIVIVGGALGLINSADATHSTNHPLQLRLRHLEPLCLADVVGPPCFADARLDRFPSITSLPALDYGSASGTLRVYSGPGWQLAGGLPDDVPLGGYMAEVDLSCDGTKDVLAHQFSLPPTFGTVALRVHNDPDGDSVPNEPGDDLENWLLPQLPALSTYPAYLRATAIADYAWLDGSTSRPLDEPYHLDVVTQRITWSPAHPATGLGTMLTSVILGSGAAPTSPDCLQPRFAANLPLYGYVDIDGDMAPETEAVGNPPFAGGDSGDSEDDAAGFYLRWSLVAAADPAQWPRDLPFANAYRGRRLDIGIIARCYYIDEAGLVAPPAGADSDRDCLEDPVTAQPARPTDANDTMADRDGDSLLDGIEVAWGSDPALADTDVDSLSDALEMALLTNPTAKDTDGDGRSDPVDNCPLNTSANQADADQDGWLLAHTIVRRAFVGPVAARDATDVPGTPLEDPINTALGTLLVPAHTADPMTGGDVCDGDADGDLLANALESGVALVTADEAPLVDSGDPMGGPPDGDGTNDLQDAGVRCVAADQNGDGTPDLPLAPLVAGQIDSDGDTYPDGVECLLGSAPASATLTNTFPPGGTSPITGNLSTPECAAPAADNDGDGRTNDCLDADSDGLSNTAERQLRLVCLRVDPGGGLTAPCDPALAAQELNGDAMPDIDSDADDDGQSGQLDGDADGDTRSDLAELRAPIVTLPSQQDTDGDGCRDDYELLRTADPSRPRNAVDFADTTHDRAVTVADINRAVSHFGRNVIAGTYTTNTSDVTMDGSITIADISRVVSQFGLTCLT